MAQKDMTEKSLEVYDDVFSDIVNVLLFQGDPIVHEEDLEDSLPRSFYKVDGKLHEQERDVAKYWKHGNIRIAFYGMENQTDDEADIPLRVIGYDGAAYRAQLLAVKDAEGVKRRKERYPVVSLVLYFGRKHWSKPLSLNECLNIPEKLKPFVNDYKINLFEISYLTDEQVALFQSDFRIVADYFVQSRKNKDYVFSSDTIKHVDAVLKLLSVMTQDYRFEEMLHQPEGGKPKTMEEILDRAEHRGIAKGRAEGRAEGKAESIVELLEECGQVTDTLRQQVTSERDITILSSWIKLAARVSSIREFEEKAGLLAK